MARYGKPAAAVLVMGAIIAILLMLCTPRSTSKSSSIEAPRPTTPPPSAKP